MNNFWKKENSATEYIPYTILPTSDCVKTVNGDYIISFELQGVPFSSADTDDLTTLKIGLNNLWRDISSPNLALYTHIIRHEDKSYPAGEFANSFAKEYNEKYKKLISQSRLKKNSLYLTVVYRPNAFKVIGLLESLNSLFNNLFAKNEKAILAEEQEDALEKLNEIKSIVQESLTYYGARILSTYQENDIVFSELLEFLAYLVNGEWQKMPLPRKRISEVLTTSRVFFGRDLLEVRTSSKEKYAGALGIKEYISSTYSGLLDSLLSASFDFILTQSFEPKTRGYAISRLQRNQKVLVNAGDVSTSLIDELSEAMDDVGKGAIVMGEHNLVLFVYANTQKELKENMSIARSTLSEQGFIVAREDLALESAYWWQLPGNNAYCTRPSLISSKNFSGFSSFHNVLLGQLHNNQWGDALTVLPTTSQTPYFFNFHEPMAQGASSQHKSLGNTLITGQSGAGKTVILGHLLLQSLKYNPTIILYDKDRGLEILVRALGGIYLPLKRGEATGFNPFCLEFTSANVYFLEKLVKAMVSTASYSLSVLEEKQLSQAISNLLQLPLEFRSMSALLASLDNTVLDGLHARLKKWCAKNGEDKPGILSWVFDAGADKLDFENNNIFGFDVTDFLEDPEVRTPIVMYLFYRQEALIDGRNFICMLDEFWKLLSDSYFEDFAKDKLKTIRKQNGIMLFATQSVQDIVKSKIANTIIEQCPNHLHLCNEKANHDDYVHGLHLTEREYEIIKNEMPPASRRFLVKTDFGSVIVKLNLKGFDKFLPVMSGNTKNILLLEEIISKVGEKPENWLPIFEEKISRS